MKVVLAALNAKYIHSNLAVHSLKACAAQWKSHIEVAEYTINQRMPFILSELYKAKPDVLAFSCYIWNMELIRELLPEIRKILPEVEIWLGGPEVSYDAEVLLKELPMIRGVMKGEGEKTFCSLMACYIEQSLTLDEVRGVVWRTDSGAVQTGRPQDIMDMDEIPFPYTDLDLFEHRILYYESSRGCPFSCSYCLSSTEQNLRFRSIGLVHQELQFFLDHKVPQVKFVDRTFNCRHDHAMGIWKYLLTHDNGVTNFHFEISADLLREEELALLARMRPGLIQLEIGVQSVNTRVVDEIDRTMDIERLSGIVKRINQMGNIHQHLDLIAGLPYEDMDSFRVSFNKVYSLAPEQLQLGFLKVLKGSKMQQKADEYGLVYRDRPPYEVLFTKWLSYDEVLILKHIEEMVEVYYNSRQFVHTLARFVKCFASPYDMFDRMRSYYEAHDLFDRSHSRMARYEILLAMIRQQDSGEEDLFRDLLLYDLYLRENLKKRPAFADAEELYREPIRNFYRQEKSRRIHIEVFRYNVAGAGEAGKFPILFDYEVRNPLNYEAAARPVRIEQGVVR